jgi:hypothetical protein
VGPGTEDVPRTREEVRIEKQEHGSCQQGM